MVSDESYSEESSYRRLSLKEIYSATDSLSMSNFIGQGIAGKSQSNVVVVDFILVTCINQI